MERWQKKPAGGFYRRYFKINVSAGFVVLLVSTGKNDRFRGMQNKWSDLFFYYMTLVFNSLESKRYGKKI